MQKKFMCAVVWFCLLCVGAIAGNIDCVKFLRAGNEKICMKTVKETSPALAMEIGNNIYYASAIAGNRGGVMFEYDSDIYSLYNYDDMEYELIHWLSGTDALVDGVWRDRVSGTVTLDFVNHGCVWNDAHDGYSSADGWEQYFTMKDGAVLDFGTDWYIEIIAKVDEPLGTSCFLVDFSSLGNFDTGTGLYFSNYNSDIGFMSANIKVEGAGIDMGTDDALYSWGKKSLFVTGVNQYSINQSRVFITYDGNRYYSRPFDTTQWKWNASDSKFVYLFRGWAVEWGTYKYQCGPTTVYDIKIWRKKQ